ncbi:MAG: glycosyltransferase family 4 protein [Ignavibacteria bacterium]|nr:glycosyltransferase family 4 protein [Ignavibacteria bacterium]
MIIGVNARMLILNKLEGQGWFTHEILRRVVRMNPQHEFKFFFDRPFSSDFIYAENTKGYLIPPRAVMRFPFLFEIWYQYSLLFASKFLACDVLISLDGFIPVRSKIPTVNVIHDLGFIHYPAQLKKGLIRYYRKRYRDCALKASKLATVSKFSRVDISEQYGIPLDEITVVYNAARAIFKPASIAEIDDTKSKWTNGCDYFIYTGIVQPRKNIARLFRAFDLFKNNSDNEVRLLIVGAKGWGDPEVAEALANMKHAHSVKFTGYVSETDLAKLMGSAIALTFIPHFEGFGIPVLEAMQCGVPVICSNVTSLPEVAGDSAILVDHLDEKAVAEAMSAVFSNENLRNDLSQKGIKRAADFSWDSSARIVSKLIEELTISAQR